MLIRISGGKKGIKEYLVGGRKSGREETREQLDDRVVLFGDLEITDRIIGGMNQSSEKYLHITLSFRENYLSEAVLGIITEEARQFFMTAFQDDEYNLYAEAHIPRIKGYRDSKTGELIERLPHIHIVIPKTNLWTGRLLNPTGMVQRNVAYFDAFQEHINDKYGLASPKDNRRLKSTDTSEMLSRYKGDTFSGQGKDLKQLILKEILEKNISTVHDLHACLFEIGKVTVRNLGKENQYFNIKTSETAKGLNLSDEVFQEQFLNLPKDEKIKQLRGASKHSYREPGLSRISSNERLHSIQEWKSIKSLEVKLVNSGNKKFYQYYKTLSDSEKQRYLEELSSKFDTQFRPTEIKTDEIRNDQSRLQEHIGSETVHSLNQENQKRLHQEQAQQKSDPLTEWQYIKRFLSASHLLAFLEKTHGLQSEKYSFFVGKDGGQRIRCGTRNYNVADFLTKEMHLSWQSASEILRKVMAQQQGQEPPKARLTPHVNLWKEFIADIKTNGRTRNGKTWVEQRQSETKRMANIKDEYNTKRQQIFSKTNCLISTPGERRSELKLAQMQRIESEIESKSLFRTERDEIRRQQKRPLQEKYCDYLENLAKQKLEESITIQIEKELKRKKNHQTNISTNGGMDSQSNNFENSIKLDLNHRIEKNGDIIYQRDGKDIIKDAGNKVYALETDDDSIEICLRLCALKYRENLVLFGSDEFIEKAIRIAVERRISLQLQNQKQDQSYSIRIRQASIEKESHFGSSNTKMGR